MNVYAPCQGSMNSKYFEKWSHKPTTSGKRDQQRGAEHNLKLHVRSCSCWLTYINLLSGRYGCPLVNGSLGALRYGIKPLVPLSESSKKCTHERGSVGMFSPVICGFTLSHKFCGAIKSQPSWQTNLGLRMGYPFNAEALAYLGCHWF